MKLPLAPVVLALAVAAAGCSSNSQSANAQSSSAPVSAATTAAAPATAATAAATAAEAPVAAAPLDVYPGATKLPTQMRGTIATCGTKMSVVVYRVGGASAQTVADWYAARIPGAIRVDVHASSNTTAIEMLESGGGAAAVVSQIHFAPALASAAKSLGSDRATLGLVTFDPPLSADNIAMLRAAASGDAAARARMKAKCGDAAG